MPIIFSNTMLCSDDAALGRIGPRDMRINGEQVNDVVVFHRADAATVFARSRSVELSFRVFAGFSTIAAAQQYAALHFGQLPKQADLICTDGEDNPLWEVTDAALSYVRAGNQAGVGLFVEYGFVGGSFESEDITLPDGDSDLVKAKIVDLVQGEVSKEVVFDSPFATPPRGIHPTLLIPAGGGAFGIVGDETTRTAEGITFHFDAAVPAAGYKLSVIAVL